MLNVKSVKWFLPVLLLFLMPGCSTTEKCAQKTEPSVQEAEAHVKNAPYRVRGKRYTPMSVADALQIPNILIEICLLYTSDAADE